MRPAKIVAIVIGALLTLLGLAMLIPGVFLLGVYGTMRDDTGFFQTSSRLVSTSGYALVSPDVNLKLGPGGWDWVPKGGKAAVRVRASSSDSGSVFVAIGPSDQVEQYLSNVARDEITDFAWTSTSVKSRHYDGQAPSTLPDQQTFWVVSREGPGVQDLEWDVQQGHWTAVVMNADGHAPVTADLSLGVRFGILLVIGIVVTIIGVVLLALGIVLIVLGARRSRAPAPAGPPAGYGPHPGYGPQPGYGTPAKGWEQPPAGWVQTPQGWVQTPPGGQLPADMQPPPAWQSPPPGSAGSTGGPGEPSAPGGPSQPEQPSPKQ